MTFDAFSREFIDVAVGRVFVRRTGSGPVVLLLHGYPETNLAWRKVAPDLANEFTIVAADLPGYGESTLSNAVFADGRISKRTMARALADAMTELGFAQFAVVGHDRGARVAYRLALDEPTRIRALSVLDVIPILDMAERLTYDAARQMGHWLWLTQPSTVPETLIGLDPDLYVRHIVEQWGGSDVIERETVEEYVRCMRHPNVLRTMGAEYRADLLDVEDDRADRMAARRIACPVLALWAQGGLTEQFGDPLAIWRSWADDVDGRSLAGGHFLMEESPRELTALVGPFLKGAFRQQFEHPHGTKRARQLTTDGLTKDTPTLNRVEGEPMATSRQRAAARRNIKKAANVAKRKRTIAHLPKQTRTALGKEGSKAAARKQRVGR